MIELRNHNSHLFFYLWTTQMNKIRLLLCTLPILLGSTLPASVMAASIGTHCWEQQPFSHVFCFDANDLNGRYYSLVGEDIIPGEATYPVRGSALFDSQKGVLRVEFTQNLGQSYVFENTCILDASSLSGTWSDNGGNAGNFHYLGTGPLTLEQIKKLTKEGTRKKPSKQ
jgi:hypothetical protein